MESMIANIQVYFLIVFLMHLKIVTSGCILEPLPGDPYSFRLGGHVFDCAEGTEFKVKLCTCIRSQNDDHLSHLELACVEFERGKRGVTSTRGVFVKSRGVLLVPPRLAKTQCPTRSCAKTTKWSSMKMPYFRGVALRTLSVSLWFKVSGDEAADGSSYVMASAANPRLRQLGQSSPLVVRPVVVNGSSYLEIALQNQYGNNISYLDSKIGVDRWIHFVLVLAIGRITTYLDNKQVSVNNVGSSRLKRYRSALSFGKFRGYMDTITIFDRALLSEDVDFLFAHPQSCLPEP